MQNLKVLLVSYLAITGNVYITNDVQAATITVNPGLVGSTFENQSIPFNDLNNTNLNGQRIDVDFIFSDMKHLVPRFDINPPPRNFYTIELVLSHNGGFPAGPNLISGFLSDEKGNSIAVANPANIQRQPNLLTYRLQFDQTVDDLIHHDIHFDINLPNANNAVITGGQLDLEIRSPRAVIEVGEWEKVPEFNSNFGFLTLIIIGVILKISKKRSKLSKFLNKNKA